MYIYITYIHVYMLYIYIHVYMLYIYIIYLYSEVIKTMCPSSSSPLWLCSDRSAMDGQWLGTLLILTLTMREL